MWSEGGAGRSSRAAAGAAVAQGTSRHGGDSMSANALEKSQGTSWRDVLRGHTASRHTTGAADGL
jgi:hypothetical protein